MRWNDTSADEPSAGAAGCWQGLGEQAARVARVDDVVDAEVLGAAQARRSLRVSSIISWRRFIGIGRVRYSLRKATSIAPSIDMAQICAEGQAKLASAEKLRPPHIAT